MQSTNFTAGYTLYNGVCDKIQSSSSSSVMHVGKLITLPGIVKTIRYLIIALFVMHVERMVT